MLGGVGMALQLRPNRLPHAQDPDALDNIFGSRLMVWVIRMALFVGVVYAVGSGLALISQNAWLSDFGPFKVSEWVSKLANEVDEQTETGEDLLARLEQRDRELAEAIAALNRLKGGGQPPPEDAG